MTDLTACIIARDEEELLPRCLESVRRRAGEIVLVDTGSTDRTAEIAREHGATVLTRPWDDDFAAAKNHALDAARGRYVLFLDADEWVAASADPRALRHEAYTVELRDHLDGGREERYPLVRIWRNRPEHRFRGRIHEQIVPAIAARAGRETIEPPVSGWALGHDGYRHARMVSRDKVERNRRLLRASLAQDPDDAACRYFLVRELVTVAGGRAVPGASTREAVELLDEAAAPAGAIGADLERLRAAALLAVGRSKEAHRCLERFDGEPTPILLLRADLALATRSVSRDLLDRVRAAFDRPERGRLPSVDSRLAGPVARARAAELLAALGETDEALRLAQAAAGPEAAAPWVFLAGHAGRARAGAGLPYWLEGARADPHDPWVWAGLGEELLRAGATAEARPHLENALRLVPGWTRVERALGVRT